MTDEKKGSIPWLNFKWKGLSTDAVTDWTLDKFRNAAKLTKSNPYDDRFVEWLAKRNRPTKNGLVVGGYALGIAAGLYGLNRLGVFDFIKNRIRR